MSASCATARRQSARDERGIGAPPRETRLARRMSTRNELSSDRELLSSCWGGQRCAMSAEQASNPRPLGECVKRVSGARASNLGQRAPGRKCCETCHRPVRHCRPAPEHPKPGPDPPSALPRRASPLDLRDHGEALVEVQAGLREYEVLPLRGRGAEQLGLLLVDRRLHRRVCRRPARRLHPTLVGPMDLPPRPEPATRGSQAERSRGFRSRRLRA